LKEHQSSIINIETRLKSIQNNKNMNRNLGDEIDQIKFDLSKKQNSENEIILKTDLNKQNNELKKLKDDLKSLSESVYKSKYNTNTNSKEYNELKDEIITLKNLMNISLNNVEDRLFRMEDKNYDMMDLKRNKTMESRIEFKYNINKINNKSNSKYINEKRSLSNDKSGVYDRLSKKKSYLYYDEVKHTFYVDENNNESNFNNDYNRPNSAIITHNKDNVNVNMNRSMNVSNYTIKNKNKSHSQGNIKNYNKKDINNNSNIDNNVLNNNYMDIEAKKQRIANNYGLNVGKSKSNRGRSFKREKFKLKSENKENNIENNIENSPLDDKILE